MLSARKHHFIVEFYDTYAFSFFFVTQDSGVSWTLMINGLFYSCWNLERFSMLMIIIVLCQAHVLGSEDC